MGWYRILESGQIEAFDMTFKRWNFVCHLRFSDPQGNGADSQALETIVPQLLPFMGKALAVNASTMQPEEIMQRYLAASICQVSAAHCTGSNAQFGSVAECIERMTTVPTGEFDRSVCSLCLCRAHGLLADLAQTWWCVSTSSCDVVDQD